MIIKDAVLETVCGFTSVLPDNKLPEIAFAGKSNVGKSSLINKMVCRKSLARTSSEPGKTQTINYYRVNNAIYLVDLPGYGYAKVGKKEREKWGEMIDRYLDTSQQLKLVVLLVDIRHTPGENDKMMYEWIVSRGYQPVIVCTKTDKLKRSQVDKAYKTIRSGLGLPEDTRAIKFSAETGQGRDEIWNYINDLIMN